MEKDKYSWAAGRVSDFIEKNTTLEDGKRYCKECYKKLNAKIPLARSTFYYHMKRHKQHVKIGVIESRKSFSFGCNKRPSLTNAKSTFKLSPKKQRVGKVTVSVETCREESDANRLPSLLELSVVKGENMNVSKRKTKLFCS